MRKQTEWNIKQYDYAHRYKIALEVIIEFLNLIPESEFSNPEKCNFNVRDYSLEQFQWYVGRKYDEFNKQKKL